jgi:integrase/recombinase XerD
MKLSDVVKGYIISRTADSYSKNTLNGYATHFSQFITFLGDVEIDTVTSIDVQRFFAWLRTDYKPVRMSGDTSPLRETTIRNAWCAVRSLFTFASKELGIERPDTTVKMPKVSYPEITPFAQDEINAMLKAAEHFSSVFNGKPYTRRRPSADRDTALILLLLDTGLRVSECCRLTIRDINIETGEVYVSPMGSGRKTKSRRIYFGKSARKALWRYIAKKDNPYPDDPLFMSVDNKPMNRGSIRQLLVKIGNRAGVRDVYPHRFRHTFAIEFLRSGGDVFTLQRFLGHSTLEMVRHYLALADSDSEDAHRRASPADRWHL